MARLAGLMAAIVVGWVLALGAPAMAQQGPDEADALNAQAIKLEGNYAEAVSARRAGVVDPREGATATAKS